MSCPFKYHPIEIKYETSNGYIDKVFTVCHEYGHPCITYEDAMGNAAIIKHVENKDISICKMNDFECVGEDKCPIMKK